MVEPSDNDRRMTIQPLRVCFMRSSPFVQDRAVPAARFAFLGETLARRLKSFYDVNLFSSKPFLIPNYSGFSPTFPSVLGALSAHFAISLRRSFGRLVPLRLSFHPLRRSWQSNF